MKNRKINEATSSASSGKYKVPVILAPQIWTKSQLGPFVDPVREYTNAELSYEEADGDYLESPEDRERIERNTKKLSKVDQYLKQFYTGQNDEEGGNIASLEVPEKMINRALNSIQEENSFLNEDLAVWFGTKKKPKGSKQPKGPWVNICRKDKNGKHPPCGRSKAETKGYPKCRAVHVASKMSDSQKRSACQQKRTAEKKDPKIGKGNKPTMTSYKPKNEGLVSLIKKVLNEQYNSNTLYPKEYIESMMRRAPSELKKIAKNLKPIPCINEKGEKNMCFRIPEVLHVYFTGRY